MPLASTTGGSSVSAPSQAPKKAGKRAHRLRDLLSGSYLPIAAVGLIFRHRKLFLLALFPAFLTLLGTLFSLMLVLQYSEGLAALFWARPALCEGCSLGQWLWSGVAIAAWQSFRVLSSVLLVSATALLFARVLSAPIMDLLAEKSLQVLEVKAPAHIKVEASRPLLVSVYHSQKNALLRALIYALGLAIIALLAWVPGLASVLPPLGLVWTALWLFADTSVYALQWVGDTRLRSILSLGRRRPLLALGFSTSLTLLTMLPFAGLLTTPMAVVGACLLVQQVFGGSTAEVDSGAVVEGNPEP